MINKGLVMNFSKFLKTDSYKAGHSVMYPAANKMVAYGEFRKGYPGVDDERIVFYGINYIVDKYLNHPWTMEELDEAELFYSKHNAGLTQYPFPRDLFERFIKENHGFFPIKLQALPEGTVIYPHVPVYQITATKEYSRLVTFLETLLTQVWYPTTVATLSRHTKTIIQKAFDKSVDPEMHWLVMSRLHDFGYRGCSTDEQAMIGGAAHLLNFDGTDTMVAAQYAHAQNNGVPFAQSIPATEHSVMTAWPTELDAVQNMIEHFGSGLFACVADSFDYDNFLHNILPVVAKQVKAKGGTMVVRPDSGEPVEAVMKGLYACQQAFGFTFNKLGYKVLNNSAVIQGDGIDIAIVSKILDSVLAAGFSAQNVAFGMGAGLLHKHNRDTMSFATKLSFIEYADGTQRNIMKAPKTDMSKYSLPGVLKVFNDNGIKVGTEDDDGQDILITVYDCCPEYVTQKFSDIRVSIEKQWAVTSPKKPEQLFTDKLQMRINETLFEIRK